jgi:hypothetical protein
MKLTTEGMIHSEHGRGYFIPARMTATRNPAVGACYPSVTVIRGEGETEIPPLI